MRTKTIICIMIHERTVTVQNWLLPTLIPLTLIYQIVEDSEI